MPRIRCLVHRLRGGHQVFPQTDVGYGVFVSLHALVDEPGALDHSAAGVAQPPQEAGSDRPLRQVPDLQPHLDHLVRGVHGLRGSHHVPDVHVRLQRDGRHDHHAQRAHHHQPGGRRPPDRPGTLYQEGSLAGVCGDPGLGLRTVHHGAGGLGQQGRQPAVLQVAGGSEHDGGLHLPLRRSALHHEPVQDQAGSAGLLRHRADLGLHHGLRSRRTSAYRPQVPGLVSQAGRGLREGSRSRLVVGHALEHALRRDCLRLGVHLPVQVRFGHLQHHHQPPDLASRGNGLDRGVPLRIRWQAHQESRVGGAGRDLHRGRPAHLGRDGRREGAQGSRTTGRLAAAGLKNKQPKTGRGAAGLKTLTAPAQERILL